MAREKEAKNALKACNVLRDRSSACKEIAVDISTSLLEHSMFKDKIYPFLAARYTELHCECSSPNGGRKPDPRCHDQIIHWRRHVSKDWDEKGRYWVPRRPDEHGMQEQATVLIYLTAHDIEAAVENHKNRSLMPHQREQQEARHQDDDTLIDIVSKARAAHGPHYQVFLLIQNLSEKAKAKQSKDNASCRNDILGAPLANAKKPRKEKWNANITMDDIEDELARVVVAERCFLVRAEKPEQTVDWLVEITKDVAFKPYK